MHVEKPTDHLSALRQLVNLVVGLELSTAGVRRGQFCPGILKTYVTKDARFIAVECYEDTLIELSQLAPMLHSSVSLTVA